MGVIFAHRLVHAHVSLHPHTIHLAVYCHPVSFYHLSFLAVGLTLNTIHRENKREIFHRQTLACSVERILLLLNAVSLTKGDQFFGNIFLSFFKKQQLFAAEIQQMCAIVCLFKKIKINKCWSFYLKLEIVQLSYTFKPKQDLNDRRY